MAQPLEWVVGGGLLLGGLAWAYNTWRHRGNQNVPPHQPPPIIPPIIQQPPLHIQQPPLHIQQPPLHIQQPPLVQLPQRHAADVDMVNTLQALSVLFLAYAKGEEGRVQRGPASEVQAMRLDGHVLVSTNSRAETDPICDFFNEGTRARRSNLGGTLELLKLQSNRAISTINETTLHHAEVNVNTLIEAAKRRSRIALNDDQVALIPYMPRGTGTTPILCMGRADPGFVAFGAPSGCAANLVLREPTHIHFIAGDGQLHAEQQLLRTLAHALRRDVIPELDVVIYGVKAPCRICLAVLRTFRYAFETTYSDLTTRQTVQRKRVQILFDEQNAGRQNVNEERIDAFNAREEFRDDLRADTLFGDFVRAYRL